MNSRQQPIAVDEAYLIRDNQFWYNSCSFAELVRNKETIVLNVEGLGIRTFEHSAVGKNGQPTYSYKMKSASDADRIWWEEHRGKRARVELLIIDKDQFETYSSELSGTSVDSLEIEVLRGYEVLADNSVRFGVRVSNNSNSVITDVEVILDYPESLFKLQDSRIQKLDSIPPSIPRTAKFVLKPLGCIHKEFIEATITYRDHKWEKHIVTMKPKEIHCVCPFLKANPITKGQFIDLSNKGHSVETGINFQGIGASQLKSFLMQTCANRLHKVDEYSIDGDNVLYFSSESLGEKAYYLLTVIIKEQEGVTQVMLRAVSDKTHGIHGFLNETVSELKHVVHTVNSAKEIGIIKHEHVINIIDSVVQRSSFSLDGKTSVNVKDSVVQRSEIESPSSTTNIQDSIVQHTTIKTNANKRSDDKIAQIAHQQHREMNRRQNEEKKKSSQQNDRKKLLIPFLILILLGGLWLGLLDSADSSDELVISETEYVEQTNDDIESESIVEEPVVQSDSQTDNDEVSNTEENVETLEIVDSNLAYVSSSADIPETYTNSIGMEFVLIPAGEFMMGSDNGHNTAKPTHEVTIGNDFYLGKYEVTQGQWVEVMGNNPYKFKSNDTPVFAVSWNEAHEFINKLNAIEGTNKYRLPSEAEWEYACRAGTTTNYSFGDDKLKLSEYAWWAINSGDERPPVHAVGQKKPNPLGLYDMYGNLFEWVQDEWNPNYYGAPTDGSSWEDGSSSYRVIRGGAFNNFYDMCNSVSRINHDPENGMDDIGFRLVIES